MKKNTCLDTGKKLVTGPRRATYGPPDESFKRVALKWTGTLLHKLKPGQEISIYDVALMMIDFKTAREANTHHQDNLDDIAGYDVLLEQLYDLHPIDSFINSTAATDLHHK